jgi:hypothetical protein
MLEMFKKSIDTEGGGGFNPRTKLTELKWALAPDEKPVRISTHPAKRTQAMRVIPANKMASFSAIDTLALCENTS